MAKSTDPFEKFRSATLGTGSSLSDALSKTLREEPFKATPEIVETPLPSPTHTPVTGKVSKNANREYFGFHIDKDIKKKLEHLKVEYDLSFNDLLTEAINDLLVKYGK